MQSTSWSRIRNEVIKVNPDFAKIIDNIDPGDNFTIYKVIYPYGSEVLKRGLLHLPNKDGRLVPFNSPSIPAQVQQDLGYSLGSNPVSVVLKNSMEVFVDLGSRIASIYKMVEAGDLFGLWKLINPKKVPRHPKFLWDITAGARSVFMLPKISDIERHLRLCREFSINNPKPTELIDHWDIFRGITSHKQFNNCWNLEIMFFSEKWFNHRHGDSAPWLAFHHYLKSYVLESGAFWRNYYFWGLIFTLIEQKVCFKPSSYITDTVKCLFAIGVGELPGFAPATDDTAMPASLLQEVYANVYNLGDYQPVIMQPKNFELDNKNADPVYYSLKFSNTTELAPHSRKRTSVIKDLYEIRLLVDNYIRQISNNSLDVNIEYSDLWQLSNDVNFDFFHTEYQQYQNIKNSALIPEQDKRFMKTINNIQGDQKKKFPDKNLFTRGCVRVTRK
ncbi:MAG: hypothetical protein COB50_00585 [Thiotrichales bacterium]|nr:MAG: hypothetical protein COB50_00585 [Thiotrichales bacterium]